MKDQINNIIISMIHKYTIKIRSHVNLRYSQTIHIKKYYKIIPMYGLFIATVFLYNCSQSNTNSQAITTIPDGFTN